MSDEAKSPIVRCGVWLGAIICVLGSPVMGYFLTQNLLASRASSAWPSVEGELTKARVGGTRRY